ncbi:MAG: HEAT repeat domain-containing protein [Ardenticatenaceae bacterium]|nr:HEAT repeat domain-containing protein [Ardenticatenaceae bacterium]MCB8950147.1 HEAT repeat domain-containing protein [Ardenticatenaceae bacterium]
MQQPLPPPRLIERPRIAHRLRQILVNSHVLLTAPAGYGKSVVLRNFARDVPNAQLITLTQADRDLATLRARLRPFLNAPTIILLDDIHLLAGEADICTWLQQQLTQAQPRWLLAGRSLPFVADWLLVSGQAVQFTKELLAFSLAETQALLAEPVAEAATWHTRLDGWSIALSLLSRLSAAGERLPTTEAHLFTYLTQAVFAQLAPQLNQFMQHTAVPLQFNVELAATLWGDSVEAQTLFTAVLHHDLYLQPAQKEGWYRYHDLIRGYLQQQLGLARQTIAETAVDWFWQQGEQHTAVEQALDANLSEQAANLIAQVPLTSFHGSSSYATYRRWVRALDEAALATRPMLLVRLANVIQIMPGYEDEAQLYAEQAIQLAERSGETQIMLLAQANLAHWYYQRGELTTGREIVLDALAYPGCTDYARLYSLRIASLILSDLGQYRDALPLFQEAIGLALARQAQNEPFMNRANLAWKYYLPLGKIAEAEELLTAVLTHFAETIGWLGQYLTYWCELQLVRGDWDGLAQAVTRLETALSQVETQTRHNELWLAHYQTVLAIVQEDETAVELALARYDSLAESSQLHQVCVAWLACWHLRGKGAWAEAVARGQRALAQPSQFAHYRARLALEVDIAQGMRLLVGEVDSFSLHPETQQLIRWRSRLELHRLRALLALVCWWLGNTRWQRHWTAVYAQADPNYLPQRDPELAAHFWRLALFMNQEQASPGQAQDRISDVFWQHPFASEDAHPSGVMRASFLEAVKIFRANGRLDQLLPLLKNDDPRVRFRTAVLLTEIGDERAMPPLLGALRGEKETAVRKTIEQAVVTLEQAPPPLLTVQLMGAFRLKRGDVWLEEDAWHRPIVQRLFQFFALNVGQQVSKDQILEALWPDSDPDKAWGTFRTVYSRLRKLLEPAMRPKTVNRYIEQRGETFRLKPKWVQLDVTAFVEVVTAVLHANPPDNAPALPEELLAALENYAPLLPGLPYADWLLEPRQKLAELYIEGCLYVATAYLARAELTQAITWGRRTVDAAPWLEEAYQLLLRAYARQGQRTLALRIYDEAVANLHEELNISPSRQTERLAERLRRGEPI